MIYCLACRQLSGDGPLCTQCGRSFGGRLCNGKKRHLNPPDALFCGQCGTANLVDAAAFVPLGVFVRLLALTFIGGLLLLAASRLHVVTWLVQTTLSIFVSLFALYVFSLFLPGPIGKPLQGLISKIYSEMLRLIFQIIRAVVNLIGGRLLHSGEGQKTRR